MVIGTYKFPFQPYQWPLDSRRVRSRQILSPWLGDIVDFGIPARQTTQAGGPVQQFYARVDFIPQVGDWELGLRQKELGIESGSQKENSYNWTPTRPYPLNSPNWSGLFQTVTPSPANTVRNNYLPPYSTSTLTYFSLVRTNCFLIWFRLTWRLWWLRCTTWATRTRTRSWSSRSSFAACSSIQSPPRYSGSRR